MKQSSRPQRRRRSASVFEPLEMRRPLAVTVGGVVFNDADGRRLRDAGEAALKNVKVILDQDQNGRRPRRRSRVRTRTTSRSPTPRR